MKKIFAYIMLGLIALMMGLILFSCSPQKRLNNLLNKNPQLIKHDTIWKRDTITVKGIEDSISVNENFADPKIDSLLILLSDCKGKINKDTLKKEIQREIRKTLLKEIPDTTITKDGIVFKISSRAGKLNIDIKIPERKIVENIPFGINTLQNNPVPETGFKAWIKNFWIDIKDFFAWFGFAWAIFLILLVIWKIFK